MKLIHTENYERMSQKGAELLLNTLRNKKDAVICLATGSSPEGMYEIVCEAVNRERIDLSQVTFVKLDEWYGVKPDDACTCTTFLKKHLFEKLYMQPKEVIEFVSNAPDIQQELEKMDMFLTEHPIDVMILGLGMNGHLGLNEPADSLVLNAHFAELDEKTKTHDMVKGYVPKGGLTIGLQGIFTAKQIIMLVCGERKEAAYQAFMSQRISTSTPASLLWLHPNCVTLVDDTIQKIVSTALENF